MKERTPETSYIAARNDSGRITRLSRKIYCQDLEADVRDTTQLVYNIANSNQKGKTETLQREV